MPGRDVVAIGTSPGAWLALRELVRGLLRELPGPVLVVVHEAVEASRALPDQLSR